jgi:hypothetical protein
MTRFSVLCLLVNILQLLFHLEIKIRELHVGLVTSPSSSCQMFLVARMFSLIKRVDQRQHERRGALGRSLLSRITQGDVDSLLDNRWRGG